MPRHVRFELMLIAAIAPLVAIFAFWYIPASIPAPEGFGSASEITPRFTPYLIAILMALALVGRLCTLGIKSSRGALDTVLDDRTEIGSREETLRGVGLNAVTLIYAFVLIPVAGFYLSSFAMTLLLVNRLGERRLWFAALIALAVVVFSYLLFDQLLSVRLPRGLLTHIWS